MAAPFGSDPWLDARLRNVPLPVGLVQRLNEVPTAADAEMDVQLRDVPVPVGLLERLESISAEPQRHWLHPVTWGAALNAAPQRHWALAASVLVAAGVTYLALASGLLPSLRRLGERAAPMVAQDQPAPGNSPAENRSENRSENIVAADSLVDPATADEQKTPAERELETPDTSEIVIDDLPPESNDFFPIPDGLDPFTPFPLPLLPNHAALRQNNILAGPGTLADALPVLESVTVPALHGVAPPLVRGYDLLFQLKHGDHPFVSPSANAALRTSRVPLVTDLASYELAWRYLRQGRLPPPEEVRTEEFLAAVDYNFPPPSSGALAIRTAAGPAPLAEQGVRLLQVGVQAASLAPAQRPATNLIVAVDTSATMRRSGRLEMTRRAIVELAGQLEDHDRLTLVVLGNQTEIVIENAGRENVDRMVSAIQSLEPRQSPNLTAGLEMAIGAARRGAPDDRQHRLVLVSDGLADFNVQDTPRIEKLLADSAAAGVGVQVLDLGRDESPSETVTTFSQAAHAKFARPTSVEQLHWNMLETLTGRSSVVAKAASLKVVFNPETVASYRLLGHEATTVTGPNSAESQVELRADQAATALYEIVLKPGGGDNVATAELQWSDPITYKVERRTQRISRLQFAKSLAEAPLSLQTAAVVAQTAEVLRGSYFVGSSRSLARVLELADQLAPQVREQPSVRGFLSLVAQAEKVRLYGPVLRKELRASGP